MLTRNAAPAANLRNLALAVLLRTGALLTAFVFCGGCAHTRPAAAEPDASSVLVMRADERVRAAVTPREQGDARRDAAHAFATIVRPDGTLGSSEFAQQARASNEPATMLAGLNAVARDAGPAIVAASVAASGDGFEADGRAVVRGYARRLFVAGGAAATTAQANLERVAHTLLDDVVAAKRDGGARLEHDFGATTFGSRAQRDGNAAQTLGDLWQTVRSAAVDARDAGGAGAAEAQRRIDALDEGMRRSGTALARARPNEGLAQRFDDGSVRAAAG